MQLFFPTSFNSFAYKCKTNTKDCLQQHIDSNFFYKLDISKFFESISKTIFMSLFKKYLLTKINDFYCKYKISISTYLNMNDYRHLFSSMQINHIFPIGFVTSPVISDFYLYLFDQKYSKYCFNYTRYADDILFSSEKKLDYNMILEEVSADLSKLKLKINQDKIRRFKIKKNGDSVKFLGLIICKKEGENKITISNQYLMNTSKMIAQYENNKRDVQLKEKCIGMCNYIKYIDYNAFLKLKKIYKIKTKKDIPIRIK